MRVECRFHPEGYQFSPKYQDGLWDGYFELYRFRKFPIGLLPRIQMTILLSGEQYRMIDLRTYGGASNPVATSTILRPYQSKIIDEAMNRGFGLIQAPTGAGKTVMFIEIMARYGVDALVIVPTIDLVDQTLDTMKALTGIEGHHATTEFIKAMVWPGIPFWAVSTWQSIYSMIRRTKRSEAIKRKKDERQSVFDERKITHREKEAEKKEHRAILRRFLNMFGVVIADEAHVTGAECVYDVMSWMNTQHRFGCSATPFRNSEDDLRMFAAIGPISGGITASELIDMGYLVPPKIRFIRMPHVKPTDYKKWQTVYTECIVENEERNMVLAAEAVRLAGSGRQTLVMVQRIPHGQILENEIGSLLGEREEYYDEEKDIRKWRWTVEPDERTIFFVNGKISKKKRKEFTARFREGLVPIAISSSVWNQGVDFPAVEGMVLAGPYKSAVANIQRIGRGLRPNPDRNKEDVIVIETWDQKVPYLRDWANERYALYKNEPNFQVIA